MKLSSVLLIISKVGDLWGLLGVFFVGKKGRRLSFLQGQCTKTAQLMAKLVLKPCKKNVGSVSWEDGEEVNLCLLAARSTCFVALPQLEQLKNKT